MANDPNSAKPYPTPKRRDFVTISKEGLPETEAAEVNYLLGFISSLGDYERDFYSALSLLDFSYVRREEIEKTNPHAAHPNPTPHDVRMKTEVSLLNSWLLLSARDGAMTLFNYSRTLESLKISISNCPTLSKTLDHDLFRKTRRDFKQRFPHFEAIRHSIAHSGELLKNSNSRELNLLDGPISIIEGIKIGGKGKAMLGQALTNRTYTRTFEGKLVSYDLSWENWRFLEQSVDEVHSLFDRG